MTATARSPAADHASHPERSRAAVRRKEDRGPQERLRDERSSCPRCPRVGATRLPGAGSPRHTRTAARATASATSTTSSPVRTPTDSGVPCERSSRRMATQADTSTVSPHASVGARRRQRLRGVTRGQPGSRVVEEVRRAPGQHELDQPHQEGAHPAPGQRNRQRHQRRRRAHRADHREQRTQARAHVLAMAKQATAQRASAPPVQSSCRRLARSRRSAATTARPHRHST